MSDDTAARIMAELAGEAEFIDGGVFSIDPEAARRKLADRQLASREAWILLVIEAAELLGADRVVVQDRPLRLEVELLGPGPAQLCRAEELPDLFAWVFSDLSELGPEQWARARARQLLALAVNAALAPPVHSISLARITRSEAQRLVLIRDGAGVVGAIPPGAEALRLGLDCSLGALESQLDIPRPELVAVAERCGYGSTPIEVLGRLVPPRPSPSRVRVTRAVVCEGQTIGEAEIVVDRAPPSVAIVGHGVLLERIMLPGWALGFRAVLHAGYERDLSLGRAIRDAAFDRSAAAVRATHDQLVAELQARGEAVEWATAAAMVVAAKPDPLRAMANDPENSRGHNALWFTLGFAIMGTLASGASVVLAVMLGSLSVASGGLALYSLRMRKVFGDEG